MSDALMSAESAKLIAEVDFYLKNDVSIIEIFEESQKVGAAKLGNELQKKYKVIEDARKKEKGVWDEKAKAVQNEFKPVLDLITEKKNLLAQSITKYDRAKEVERQRVQAELEAIADAERKKLEAFAGKREERAAMYQKKVDEARNKLAGGTYTPEEGRVLLREVAYYESKVREFSAKANDAIQQAAQVVAPVVESAAASHVSGTRKKMVARVDIVNPATFAKWCVDNNEMQFLVIAESAIAARLRETEGRFQAPGIVCCYTPEMAFSGR